MVIAMKESGKMMKGMDMVSIDMKMEGYMKEVGKAMKSTDKVTLKGQMEGHMHMKEGSIMVRSTDMEMSMKEDGKMTG
jgi:hypothetical protein